MDAVDDGRITHLGAVKTFSAYMTAGMDTTVHAISALLRLFAEQPEVWRALRNEPSLAAAAFEELLRLETPILGFFRITTRDVPVGGATIPEGARVMLHWGAANRDPDHYPDPAAFDIRRNPVDHLAFGYGAHSCAGQGLARMEVMALLLAFISRVQRFELTGNVARSGNPVVRGLNSVPIALTPAESRL
jgi:cytochrome P450